MSSADPVEQTAGGTPRFDLNTLPDIEVIEPTSPVAEGRSGPEPVPELVVADRKRRLPDRSPRVHSELPLSAPDGISAPSGPRVPGGDLPAPDPAVTPRHRTAAAPAGGGVQASQPSVVAVRPTPMTRVASAETAAALTAAPPRPSEPTETPSERDFEAHPDRDDEPVEPSLVEAPAPTAVGAGVTAGDVDLHGEWILPDGDDAGGAGPAKGRLSRLVGALRTPDRPAGERMSYRGVPMARPEPETAHPPTVAIPLAGPLAEPLLAVLDARADEDDVAFAPGDIETIIGRPLPPEATTAVRWWMLSGQPWRRAGYAATLDTDADRVTFHRL